MGNYRVVTLFMSYFTPDITGDEPHHVGDDMLVPR